MEMVPYGYSRRILKVDLTSRKVDEEPLEDSLIHDFVGGFGINVKLASDLIPSKVDPFSAGNPVILGVGPLVGTSAPGSSRTVVASKFPLSGAVSIACSSMRFGLMLKNSGYDHVVIRGRSENPCYLKIYDGDVDIINASGLWGLDTNETYNRLAEFYRGSSVISIGPSGEKLVRFSLALVDKSSTIGRGGLGAVMGAKNLKAIVAKGTRGVEVAKPKEFQELCKSLMKEIYEYPKRTTVVDLGMLSGAPISMAVGATGGREKAAECTEKLYLEKLKKARRACPSCPLGDKDILEVKKDGDFKGLTSHMTSVMNAFWLLLVDGITNHGQAVKCLDALNRSGIDLYAAMSLLSAISDMYRDGLITTEMTEGVEPRKDFQTMMWLIELISKRRGWLGSILAGGWRTIVGSIRGSEKYSVNIKGVDIVWDPRMLRLGTMEFEQVVNPRGAHVASGGSPTYLAPGRPLDHFLRHFERMGIPKDAVQRIYMPPKPEMGINVGRLTRYAEDWYTLLSSLGICARAHINRFYSAELCAKLYSAATGIEKTSQQLLRAAERSWNLLRILNHREGFDSSSDKFPDQWFTPLRAGNLELKLLDFYAGKEITKDIAARLIIDYYDERGWDLSKGIPTENKLAELEITTAIRP
nr:aldehyde ferredoxin oxidoreductase N-terminal domain-containing protein [Candidatus Njordarchaeota archaeon]